MSADAKNADNIDGADDADADPPDSIRAQYQRHGAEAYYRDHAAAYSNPHEPEIVRALATATERWRLDLSRVLDLAAGTGEATLALQALGAGEIDACEPYLFQQYQQRVGRPVLRWSFEDVETGVLAGRSYSLIVCSFALHLATPSRLPALAFQLSRIAPALLVLTPHKRPTLRPEWGWQLEGEFVASRVRCRCYRTSDSPTN